MVESDVEARMVVNESLLREANDTVRRREDAGDVQDEHEFVCECGARGCSATIRVTLSAYEAARREGRNLVAFGHAPHAAVVGFGARYLVVDPAHG